MSSAFISARIKFMKKAFLCIILLFLGACAPKNPLTDFRFQTVTAPPYVVASWYKIEKQGDVLRVYIEGDGTVLNADGSISANPTPTDTYLRQLASADPNPNVVYLGRPCQYLQAGPCNEEDWTSGRYAGKIVDSMEETVYGLMKKARTNKVVLIGYDGGAQIAGLIAVRFPQDNVEVITIGGILDHYAWTQYHKQPPLIKSMNLADYKKRYGTLEQHHFVGGKDNVVPAALVQEFVADETTVIVVPKATHEKGFEAVSKQIYKIGTAL